MRRASRPQPKRSKRVPLLIIAGMLVIGGIITAVILSRQDNELPVAKNPVQTINKQPATEEEKQTSQDSKDQIIERNNTSETPTGTQSVTPVVTRAEAVGQQIEVEAYVSGVVEESGSCTLKATQGSTTITKKGTAFANARTTNCEAFRVNRSEFPTGGSWSLTVTYDSAKASGTSQATNLLL